MLVSCVPILSNAMKCITRRSYRSTAQNDNLQVHEEKSKGVYVKGLSDFYVSSAQEVYEIMRQGGAARVVSYTSEYIDSDTSSIA